MPSHLPRRLWVLVCAIGVAVAVVLALIPVGVRFGDDPLLRLRELDPELSPPAPTAVCGSPISHLSVQPGGTSLYDAARAHACEDAGRRRLLIAVAAGLLIFVFGLAGLAGSRRPEPGRTKPVGLLSDQDREVRERD